MSQRLIIITLFILMGFILSCSGNSSPTVPENANPENPDNDWQNARTGENTIILGVYDLLIDFEKGTVEAVPSRTADPHFNIWNLLTAPACTDCFLAKDLNWDPLTSIVSLEIGWRNPYNIGAYDIRTIITEFGLKEVRNPDGYTDLWGSVPGELDPFLAMKGGPGQREFQAYSSYYDYIEIYHPTWPVWIPISLLVEASYPINCLEPYEVSFAGISGDLYNDGSNAPVLLLNAHDWQNDVESVKVDLTSIGGSIVDLHPSVTLPDVWEGPVSCGPGTSNGEHTIHVWAVTAPPFDQTPTMHNFIKLTVSDPPPPGSEVFGPPERISNSSGASFIWPRHAIAVTGNGASHVVWVEEVSNPTAWHVMYSTNTLQGGEWTPPQQIDAPSGDAKYATIAAGPDDVLHVVWEDQRDHVLGSDIYYANSLDGFMTETKIQTGANGLRNVHPKIECANTGTLHVVWHTKEMIDLDEYEYDAWYLRNLNVSSIWDSPLSIAADEGIIESFPAVTPGPFDSAYIAYQSGDPGSTGIYFRKSTGDIFSDPAPVVINDAHQPSLDVTPGGWILVAFFDSVDGTYTDIYFRLSQDGGGTWGTSQLVSTGNDAYQVAPDVECTLGGDLNFAWHEEGDTGYPGRVLFREYLAVEGWQDVVEIVGTGGIGAFPSMDGDSGGNIHMVYELFTPAEPPDEDNYEIWYRDSVG